MIVLWRVTDRCNYACAFCAFDRRLPGMRRDADPALVRRFGAVLGEYARMTGERVLVSWLGGEPLLWEPWRETSRWLREQPGIAVSATTNGSTLHLPAVREGVLAVLSELTISVDGLAPFHEAIRGCPGGWARLREAVLAIVRAREAAGGTLKLRVNTVLMRDNLDGFRALGEELCDWGIDEITINQLGGRDRPEFFPSHRLRPCDVVALRALLPDLQARLAARGVRLCANPAYLDRIEASALGQSLPVADCAPGGRFLFVDEAGRVAPCAFTGAHWGVPVAELHDAAAVLALPTRFREARRSAPARVCDDCPSTQLHAKFATTLACPSPNGSRWHKVPDEGPFESDPPRPPTANPRHGVCAPPAPHPNPSPGGRGALT